MKVYNLENFFDKAIRKVNFKFKIYINNIHIA